MKVAMQKNHASNKNKQGAKAKNGQKAQKPKGIQSAAGGTKTQCAPAAEAYEKRSGFSARQGTRYPMSIEVEGSDHIEYVIIPNPETPGAVCNEVYVSPSEFGGTRLEKYAALYEKFLFEKLEFEYVPSTGSDTKGAIVLSYDRDINDPTPPPDEQGVRQFTAYEGAVDGNVWTRHVCKARLSQPDSGYYTNPIGEDRLSYQGQFYIAITVPTGEAAGTTIGRLYLHYKCHFFTPQLEDPQALIMDTGLVDPSGDTDLPGTGGDADWMKLVNDFASVVKGNPAFKPVLDSLGKYYVDLPQGVYHVLQSLIPNQDNSMLAAATGSAHIYTPTLEAKEPMPAAAPQPWIASTGAYVDTFFNSGDVWNGMANETILGIPRGGARMYNDYDVLAAGGIIDAGSAGSDARMYIQRLSNYLSSPTGTYTALWRGQQECRSPRQFLEVAKKRSNRPRLVRLTVVPAVVARGVSVTPSQAAAVVKRMVKEGASMAQIRDFLRSLPEAPAIRSVTLTK